MWTIFLSICKIIIYSRAVENHSMEGVYRWKERSDEVAHIVRRKCVTTALTTSTDCGARATTTHCNCLIALTGNATNGSRDTRMTPIYWTTIGSRRISQKRAQGLDVPVTLSLSPIDNWKVQLIILSHCPNRTVRYAIFSLSPSFSLFLSLYLIRDATRKRDGNRKRSGWPASSKTQ